MVDNCRQIARLPAVVKAKTPILLSTTAAKIPRKRIPSRFIESRGEASDVTVFRASLKTVRDHRQSPMPRLAPVQIEKVPIRQFESLCNHTIPESSWQKRPQNRLQMPVSQK
jgi:hypothetical protein